MKLLGSRLLLLAAFFTFSSAYVTTTSGIISCRTSLPDLFCNVPFTLSAEGVNAMILAPLEKESFTATFKEGGIALRWDVTSPQKGSFYMVQRSDDGNAWYTIGGIAIREKVTSPQSYEMFDKNLKVKTYHYKLKEIKLDGSIVYSPSVTVFAGYSKKLTVYPNPAHNNLFFDLPVDVEESASLEVYDQNGRLVYKDVLSHSLSDGKQRLNIADFPTGIYVVNVYMSDERYTGRIVKN